MLWPRRHTQLCARFWLALTALFCGAASGQPPSYSAAGIVNASDYSSGPFAPNAVVSLFGTNLAYSTAQAIVSGNALSTELAGVHLLVDGSPAPLLFVGSGQINFLVPSNQIPGDVTVQVVRQGVAGPAVTVTLVAAAPALFADGNYVIAQDGDTGAGNATVTADAPAHPGEMIVLYATGLGHTVPNYGPGEIPTTAAYIDNWTTLQVLLNGTAIDPQLMTYAGLTPGCVGLYQINTFLPATVSPDPEIRVSFAGQTSTTGLKLAVQPTSAPPVH